MGAELGWIETYARDPGLNKARILPGCQPTLTASSSKQKISLLPYGALK